MRVCALGILLALLLLVTACKRQQHSGLNSPVSAQAAYSYFNTAFSQQPGEAWSGDTEAMLKDMEAVIKKGDYGRMAKARGIDGFTGRFSQSLVLRPLKKAGTDGTRVYALESTACGPAMAATPLEEVRELFNRKYTAYSVSQR